MIGLLNIYLPPKIKTTTYNEKNEHDFLTLIIAG
jgi:hypothetical protein